MHPDFPSSYLISSNPHLMSLRLPGFIIFGRNLPPISHHHWSPAPGAKRLPQFLLPSSQYTEKQRFGEHIWWADMENPLHRWALKKQKHIYGSSMDYGYLVRNVFRPQNHKQLSTNTTEELWRVMTGRTLAWGRENELPGVGNRMPSFASDVCKCHLSMLIENVTLAFVSPIASHKLRNWVLYVLSLKSPGKYTK